MKWEKAKFGSLFSTPTRNGVYKNKEAHGKGVKIVNMGEIFGYDFIGNQEMQRIVMSENEMKVSGLQENDLLFARRSLVESGAGKASIVLGLSEPTTFESSIIRVRLNSENCFPLFYFYWLRSHAGRTAIGALVTGTNVKGIRGSALKDIDVDYPDIDTQRRIADVLMTYDNLIENNQKQIKLLEEAAQRLYKKWFVDLRFPGYEDTPILDGVPDGWRLCALGDIDYTLESGSRPKGGIDASLSNGVPSIGAENVIGLGRYNYTSEKLVTRDFFSKMKRGKLKDRDILVYKDGAYIGKTSLFQDGFPYVEASVNEHVFLLHSDEELLQYYLFFTLYQQEYYLKMQKLNKNAAQPGINQAAMASLPLLIPTEHVLNSFDGFIAPIMHKIFDLAKQNRNLELARDCLLPKLISGEIEV